MQEEQGLVNAEPVNGNKERNQAVTELAGACTEENLWKCVMAFQGYPFFYQFRAAFYLYTENRTNVYKGDVY